MKPIVLTSPPIKYPVGQIKTAQELLAGANAFKQDFHPGPIDDQLGAQTIGAITRAKTLLGYPTRDINGSMGELLEDYLNGKKILPLDYQSTRRVRLHAIAQTNATKIQAMNYALADAEAHIKEDPAGSNMNQYGLWYGFNGVPWCCIAVTFWMIKAGNNNFTRGSFAAAVSNVTDAARNGERHLALTTAPVPGDLIDYRNGEHIEIFVGWIDQAAGTFWAVGGNTSSSDGSYNNGGEVAKNSRSVSGNSVSHFIAVGV